MSGDPGLATRSPADVGYLPWLLHRVSALALVGLLALHVAVQVYDYAVPFRWAVYGRLLDFTFGLVLLHGFFGVRATVLETSLPGRARRALIWLGGIAALGLFLVRLVAPP